jgi:transcriptional regulator with XRE-family HTH domain
MPPVPHPIKARLAERRYPITRLSSEVGCNAGTLGRVINGYVMPWPALRTHCSERLGLPEDELFRPLEGVER